MLARYQIVRGRRRQSLPDGVRQDIRKHTRHILRPDSAAVARFLDAPSEARWHAFREDYLATLAVRYARDRSPFDALAALARAQDVYLGCSCPTKKNPDVQHCHTLLALEFMKHHYPDIEVRFPP